MQYHYGILISIKRQIFFGIFSNLTGLEGGNYTDIYGCSRISGFGTSSLINEFSYQSGRKLFIYFEYFESNFFIGENDEKMDLFGLRLCSCGE